MISKTPTFFKNINLFRFIFIIMIVVNHFVYIGMNQLQEVPDFTFLFKNSHNLTYTVEMFFAISGFLFIRNFNKVQTWSEFFKRKFARLWSVIFFTFILFLIAAIFKLVHLYFIEDVETLFFLNGLVLNARENHQYYGYGNIHASWFVSAMLYVTIVFTCILKLWGKEFFYFLLALTIVPCAFIYNHNITIMYPSGLVRAFYSMGLGCLLGELYSKYQDRITNIISTKCTKVHSLFIGFVELGLFTYLFLTCAIKKIGYASATDTLLLFLVIMLLFLCKAGWFSNMLNNNISATLGKYAYSILITHCFILELAKNFYYNQTIYSYFHKLIQNVFISNIIFVSLPIIISIVFAILTYYLVEKPCYIKLKTYWSL